MIRAEKLMASAIADDLLQCGRMFHPILISSLYVIGTAVILSFDFFYRNRPPDHVNGIHFGNMAKVTPVFKAVVHMEGLLIVQIIDNRIAQVGNRPEHFVIVEYATDIISAGFLKLIECTSFLDVGPYDMSSVLCSA